MSVRHIADWPTPDANIQPRPKQLLLSIAVYGAMVAILLVPAIWNGFPFVFPDTGGYLLRPFAHDLDLGRSALYGAFLATGIPVDFWSNVLIQALVSAWIITLVLRTAGFPGVPTRLAVTIALAIGTSLPWYVGQLQPDIFMSLAVLAFYLSAFAAPQLARSEIVALVGIIAFSIAVHMSIFAVLLLLFASFIALWIVASGLLLPRPRLVVPAASLVLGAALALVSNYAIAGVLSFTPGGSIFLFGRLLQDGYVKAYLAQNCPDPALSICRYRDQLPDMSGDWLWDPETPLLKLGGWRGFTPEADRIILAIVVQQPVAQVATALKESLQQVVRVASGDGFDASSDWHTKWVLTEHAPGTLAGFDAAAQQRNAIDFHALNLLHVPLALVATLLLPVLVVVGWRRWSTATALVLATLIAVAANAAVCATFSSVEDRYQSRIAWIAVLAAGLAGFELIKSRRGRAEPLSVDSASQAPIRERPAN